MVIIMQIFVDFNFSNVRFQITNVSEIQHMSLDCHFFAVFLPASY